MAGERVYWSDEEYERVAKHLAGNGVSAHARGLSGHVIRAQREVLAPSRWRNPTSLRASATIARLREIMTRLAGSAPAVDATEAQTPQKEQEQPKTPRTHPVSVETAGDYLSAIAKRMGRVLAEQVMNSALDHLEAEMPRRLRAASVGPAPQAPIQHEATMRGPVLTHKKKVVYSRTGTSVNKARSNGARVELERLFGGGKN